MSATLYYSVGGQAMTADRSNDYLDFIETVTANRRTITLLAHADMTIDRIREDGVFTVGKRDRFLLNGYQSWTDTKEFTLAETEKDVSRLPKWLIDKFSFDRYGDATFYPYSKKKLHGYDVFYSRGEHNGFFFSRNAKTCYLLFEVDRASGSVSVVSNFESLSIGVGDKLTLMDYQFAPDFASGVKLFRETYSVPEAEKIFGYTSWYNHYQNISEAQILRDLDALDDRFNLFQIDDGYETYVGDWMKVDPRKFPNGLKPIVEKIHAKGLKAGIWLAPFVAESNSQLFRKHRKWFRRGTDGKPLRCGGNWSGFYALDMENEEACDYIRSCLQVYIDLGFDFFKLDFLYAVSLPRYEGKTRAMVADRAYAFLRDVLGDRLILGCGATVFNCAGKFDYLRVGPDVSLKFDDVWFMRKMHRERISTKATLQNTVYRSFLDGALFGNDPDVFVLREKNVGLNARQKESLLTLNSLFGSVLMTSDYLAGYSERNRALLDAALNRFRNAQVLDYEGEGKVIRIRYRLCGEEHRLTYNTETGVLK